MKPESSDNGKMMAVYSWSEVNKHSKKDSRWIVIDKLVYDVTNWSKKHPGGSVVLGHFAGQDATEAFTAFHAPSIEYVRKFLKPLLIGKIADEEKPVIDLTVMEDFENLRQTADKMGLFQASYFFFIITFLHILALEFTSYYILAKFGIGWIPWIISILIFATAQTQLGWNQHDAGHLSVFKSTRWNRVYHQLLFSFMKGGSAKWWNHMHFQHHSKPNVIGKDPDVRLEALFVIGDEMPVKIAKSKASVKFSMPYNLQHKYFFFIGPPLLIPTYFTFMVFRHAVTRRLWIDFTLMILFYVKVALIYGPLLGFTGTLIFFEIARIIESHWFVWVTQSNHIPMEIKSDSPTGSTWFLHQLSATCDIQSSFFNDWFTGHLNFQIEHHLFPTMPRHNLYKIAPLVKSLCVKHGVPYRVKSLKDAMSDVVRSLKKSGEIWSHAYEEMRA